MDAMMDGAKDKRKILKPELKIAPDQVMWFFIEDYYDGPIAGLALFQDRVTRFCTFPEHVPEHHIYVLHELDESEMREALEEKAEFERMVGTHWSFDEKGEPLERIMRPRELQEEYYRGRESNIACEPEDKPILAWFDARDR